MAEHVDAIVRAALADALPGKTLEQLAPVAGGLGGDTFRAELSGRRVIVKRIRTGSHRLLSLEREAELIEQVAAIGHGPRLIAVDTSRQVLVTEYLADAKPLSTRELRSAANLERIAACLKRLHGLAIELPRFSPSRCMERYVAALGGEAALTGTERGLAQELAGLSAAFESDFEELAPCHNDLVAENLLSGARLLLVDFEYAQASTPLLDLASLVEMNALAPAEEATLIGAYYGDEAPCSPTEFAKVRRLVSLLTHFWARVWGDAQPVDVERYLIGEDRSEHD